MQMEWRPRDLLWSKRLSPVPSVAVVNWLVIAGEIRLSFGTKEVLGTHGHCPAPLGSLGVDKSKTNDTKTDTYWVAASWTWTNTFNLNVREN